MLPNSGSSWGSTLRWCSSRRPRLLRLECHSASWPPGNRGLAGRSPPWRAWCRRSRASRCLVFCCRFRWSAASAPARRSSRWSCTRCCRSSERPPPASARSIPRSLEAADAMGMTPMQRLWQVELPLALPAIIAGIRVSAVVGVGTVTIAAAIGAGGLGEYIYRGLSMVDATVILAGAIPVAALALLDRRVCCSRRRGRGRPAAAGGGWRPRSPLSSRCSASAWQRAGTRRGAHRRRIEELHRAGDSRRADGAGYRAVRGSCPWTGV